MLSQFQILRQYVLYHFFILCFYYFILGCDFNQQLFELLLIVRKICFWFSPLLLVFKCVCVHSDLDSVAGGVKFRITVKRCCTFHGFSTKSNSRQTFQSDFKLLRLVTWVCVNLPYQLIIQTCVTFYRVRYFANRYVSRQYWPHAR